MLHRGLGLAVSRVEVHIADVAITYCQVGATSTFLGFNAGLQALKMRHVKRSLQAPIGINASLCRKAILGHARLEVVVQTFWGATP